MNDPPAPPPLTDLERLALQIVPELFGLSIDERANWLFSYLRREIARRLRSETSVPTQPVIVVCVKCGGSFELSQRRANGSNVCHDCRYPANDQPDETHRRWVAQIPDESLDGLLAAVSAMR